MYRMSDDTYECDFCRVSFPWNVTDEAHGDMWGCELCGKDFCEKCFVDRFGRKAFDDMLHGALSGPFEMDRLYCPECFERELKEAKHDI